MILVRVEDNQGVENVFDFDQVLYVEKYDESHYLYKGMLFSVWRFEEVVEE